MHWIADPGTSAAEEQRTTPQVSRELRAIPGVRSFGSHIGQAFLGDEIAGVNFGENWISVDPIGRLRRDAAAVHEVVDGYPGLYRDVQTYLNERIEEVLTGSERGHRGPDLRRRTCDVLRDEGERGQRDPGRDRRHGRRATSSFQVDVPQIQVRVDLDKAASGTASSRATCGGRRRP